MTPKQKKGRTWKFWMGFSDGRPHVWNPEGEAPAKDRVVSVSRKRKADVPYEDVRRVEITEILPTPKPRKR